MPTIGAPSPAPDARARILLVDDDPMITQLITDMLSLDGYEVETAPNGVAALAKIEGRRYDLILTDLHMPELDGAGLYRELAKRQTHPPQKIIFLTGTAGTSEAHRLVQETGLPLLRKPFNVVELLELVRKVLSAA
ncbi:MAG: response regulator [Candidatus Rokubacteria bacterium]|nr:response regulator [Candidatus Rokubacteria bacterium]